MRGTIEINLNKLKSNYLKVKEYANGNKEYINPRHIIKQLINKYGKLWYNKTVTKTYKPVVEKCGQGEGSCFISQKCD